MIKIATPISTLFAKSPRQSEILALSDALEIRDHSQPVQSDLPRLFHCEASIIEPWDDEAAGRIAKIIRDNSVQFVTFHLNSCFAKPPEHGGMFLPEGHKMSREEMLQNAAKNKKSLESVLGGEVAMGVENNNFYPTGAYETVTDPEFISFLVKELGIKILLDLSHVQVSASQKRVPMDDLLGVFDFTAVAQVHLSGPRERDGLWYDAHEPLTEDDWQRAKQAISLCPNLQYVTVEYYKDGQKLIVMLKKLREILK